MRNTFAPLAHVYDVCVCVLSLRPALRIRDVCFKQSVAPPISGVFQFPVAPLKH